jgi:hypothetical protein
MDWALVFFLIPAAVFWAFHSTLGPLLMWFLRPGG